MKLNDHESIVTLTAVPVPVTWKEGEVFVIDVACGSRHTLALLVTNLDREKRLLWLGHVLRMEEDRMPKKVLQKKRRVEDLLEDHKQGWTKPSNTWTLKERAEDVWLRVKFREIDRNGRGFARQPAEAEVD
uniref:Uncharacterized protein n=1 Tax=Timema shepardi TaxID=629360 RepID=A0A7R9B913_TIMSH|nr:unnamed protein product [Timema shepardi]